MKSGCKPTGKAAYFQAINSCLNYRKTRQRVPSTPFTIFKQSCIVISISGQAVLMIIFHKTSQVCVTLGSQDFFFGAENNNNKKSSPEDFPGFRLNISRVSLSSERKKSSSSTTVLSDLSEI